MTAHQKPWIDQYGRVLPDEELRKISQTWKPQVWEDYLKTYESDQKEILAENLDLIAAPQYEEYIDVYKSLLAQDEYPQLKKVVNAALCALTKRERQTIRALYWEGLTQSQIASQLGVNRKTIVSYRDRALQKLADFLLHGAIERGVSFLREADDGQASLHM